MSDRIDSLCHTACGMSDRGGTELLYNEEERCFLRLPDPLRVPQFRVHHDVHRETPANDYMKALESVVGQIADIVPQLISGTSFSYSPAQPLQPQFTRTFHDYPITIPSSRTVFAQLRVQIDLTRQPQHREVVIPATNDTTAEYRSRDLFAEIDLVPVHEDGTIHQLIEDTWIGETARGYIAQGIWIDNDLSRFFSSLCAPEGILSYPYFPFACRFRTVVHRPPTWRHEAVEPAINRLHAFIRTIGPRLKEIQQVFRTEHFRRDLPLYREIRAHVPLWIIDSLSDVAVSPSLTEEGHKEYRLVRS